MKKRHYIGIALLTILVLLPSVAMYLVVSTNAGLVAITSRLGRIGSTTLRIEGVEGTLLDGYRVAVLDIDHPRVHLRFTKLSGRVRFTPLLWQSIDLPELAVDTALIEARRVTRTGGTWKPRFLPPRWSIHAEKLTLRQGTLVAINGSRFDGSDLTAAAALYAQEVRIYSSDLNLPNMHVTADGRVLAANPIGLVGQLNLNYKIANQPEWVAAARINGDLDKLPLEGEITAPFQAKIKGQANTLTSAWNFIGDTTVQDFDLAAFGGGKVLGKIGGALKIRLDRDGFNGRGELDPAGLAAGRFQVDATGSYADKVVTLRDAQVRHAQSRSLLTGHGTVAIVTGGPQLDLQGTWQDFRWPLRGAEPAARSARGQFSLQGVKPWRVTARGDLVAAQLAPMTVDMRGQLGTDRLIIDSADVGAFDGQSRLQGEVFWSPKQTWSVTGVATGINPAQLRPDVPGRLGFSYAASGTRFAADGDLDLRIERLAGNLRGKTARGGGQARRRNGTEWQFEKVDLQLGTAHLGLDGSLAQERNLRFSLRADDLSLLTPAAKGKLQATGELLGNAEHPVLKLKANGTGFELGEDTLRSFETDVDIDMRDNGTTRGTVTLSDLLYAGRTISRVDIGLTGVAAAHKATIDLRATHLQLAVKASGGYQGAVWKGVIDGFDANDDRDFHVVLDAPAPLQVSRREIKLGSLCLKGDNARLCGALESVAGLWHATADAEQLPLRALTAGLSPDSDYDGTINLEAEAGGGGGDPITGVVHASLRDARLVHRLSNGREERFSFGTGSVDATATASDFALSIGLDAGKAGHIKGQLDGRRNGKDWQGYPIKGSLELETDALSLIDVYFGSIDRAAGRLTTAVTIGGTLGKPSVEGELHIREGEVDQYQINLALRELSFDAKFNGSSLDVAGTVKVGDGMGTMNGQITWRDRQPYGKLHLSGEDLRIVNVPEARIQASPNLDFQIAGRRIDVTGEVALPNARLEPADITNAVLSSGDEMLVGAETVDPGQRLLVVSNITLTLGERVTINTYGLTGRLTGSINARTDESQVSRGSGELQVAEGKYTFYGRNLDIARGRLFFNNGPLADPGIDLRAQKVYPDVTAGVNVRGSLRAPRLTFYSEPAIPQSQIVSLILAGGSLESVQGSNRSGAARNDMLLQGGAILAQQLGNRVGIEDVSVESDLTNETSLVLGKYLSPRLYVSYGISLAEAINTVKLRYTIGDHWTIKTESGKARSADLVYTIQK